MYSPETRKVYSSLSHRKVKKKLVVSSREKGINKTKQGHFCKVYLNDLSILPRKQLESMLRTSSYPNKSLSPTNRKVSLELERRSLDNRFRCLKKKSGKSESFSNASGKNFTFQTIEEEVKKTRKEKRNDHLVFMEEKYNFQPEEQNSCEKELYMKQTERGIFPRAFRYQKQSTQIKQRKKFPNCFSVSDKEYFVKKYLLSQGWKDISSSEDWTLKWVQEPKEKDFRLIKKWNRENKLGAFYNHIQDNIVIRENGMGKLRDKMVQKGIKCDSFIPTRFSLPSERNKFLTEYTNSLILVLIRKHMQYFRYHQLEQNADGDPSELISIIKRHQFKILMKPEFSQTKIHLPLLIYTLLHALNLRNIREGVEDRQFEENYGKVLGDRKIISMLLKYGQTSLPLHEVMQEAKQECSVYVMEIKEKNGYIKMKHPFVTPSSFSVSSVAFFHHYFLNNYPYYNSILQNQWVIECPYNEGIHNHDLVRSLEDISHLLEKQALSNIIYRDVNNLYLPPGKNDKLHKPFSIKQWILVYPPSGYVFSHFLVRIIEKGKDKSAFHHFVNRWSRSRVLNLICQDEFEKVTQDDFGKIKENVIKVSNLLVREILNQASNSTKGCFEIMSLEMKIDADLQPWVMGVERVQIRGTQSWQRQMYQSMIASTLQIVLTSRLACQTIRNFHWLPLSTS